MSEKRTFEECAEFIRNSRQLTEAIRITNKEITEEKAKMKTKFAKYKADYEQALRRADYVERRLKELEMLMAKARDFNQNMLKDILDDEGVKTFTRQALLLAIRDYRNALMLGNQYEQNIADLVNERDYKVHDKNSLCEIEDRIKTERSKLTGQQKKQRELEHFFKTTDWLDLLGWDSTGTKLIKMCRSEVARNEGKIRELP